MSNLVFWKILARTLMPKMFNSILTSWGCWAGLISLWWQSMHHHMVQCENSSNSWFKMICTTAMATEWGCMQKKVSNSYALCVLCDTYLILRAILQSQYCSCTVLFCCPNRQINSDTASDSLPISQDKDDTSTKIFNKETGDIPCCMPQQQDSLSSENTPMCTWTTICK